MPGTVRVLLENLKREQETEKKRLVERAAAKQLEAEQRAARKIEHPTLFGRLYAAWKKFKETA